MYILVCSLHMNFEIGCKVTKNVLYAQQFLHENVLQRKQIC
jgi:hypothetical protein